MADTNSLGGAAQARSRAAVSTADENLKLFSIVVYALLLLAFCNGLTALIGVIVAYVKRPDARGTVYESHFTNAIETFWVGLVVSLTAIPLIFLFGLGLIVYCGLIVWYLFRIIKGMVHALEDRAY